MHRKEQHSRSRFALKMGEKHFLSMQHSIKSGNIFTCRASLKFQQARRIYIHYSNEYQQLENIPFSI